MPDNTPLSLDAAVSLMTAPATPPADAGTGAAPETPAPATTTPEPAAPPAQGDNTPAASESPAPADASAAATDQPAQGDAPAAADGQVEPGLLPPIEPPSGWDAAGKEVFKSLPRKAQEEIERRERDRTNELRNLQNATADQRKAADAEVTRLRDLAQRVDAVIGDQVKEIAKDFPEIKTEADIQTLATNDPARFAQFQARLMRFQSAQQAAQETKQALTTKENEAFQTRLATARTELLKEFPTWNDATVLRKEMVELQDYAISVGAPEQDARTALDPTLYKMARKAMLYDRAQAALAKAQNRQPAPVVHPGASSATPKQDAAANARRSQMAKLDKSGDIEDALALMLVK